MRVTLFPVDPTTAQALSAFEIYQTIWGKTPESFNSAPNPSMPSIANGAKSGISIQCFAHASRLDLIIGPPTKKAIGPDVIQVIDNNNDYLGELGQIAAGLERIGLRFNRLAYSPQYVAQRGNFTEANAALVASMPAGYRPTLSDEHDFIFQVNRPIPVSFNSELVLNRIVTWSTQRFQIFMVNVQPGAIQGMPLDLQSFLNTSKEMLASSVVFDVNNRVNNDLSHEVLSKLLREAIGIVDNQLKEFGMNTDDI